MQCYDQLSRSALLSMFLYLMGCTWTARVTAANRRRTATRPMRVYAHTQAHHGRPAPLTAVPLSTKTIVSSSPHPSCGLGIRYTSLQAPSCQDASAFVAPDTAARCSQSLSSSTNFIGYLSASSGPAGRRPVGCLQAHRDPRFLPSATSGSPLSRNARGIRGRYSEPVPRRLRRQPCKPERSCSATFRARN